MKPSRTLVERISTGDDVGFPPCVARSQADLITSISSNRSEAESESHKTDLTNRLRNTEGKKGNITKDRASTDSDGRGGSEHDECLRRLETVQNELMDEIALNEGLREQLQLYMIECGDYQRMKDEDDRTIGNLTREVSRLRIDKEDMRTRLYLSMAECDRLKINNCEYSMIVAKLEHSIKSHELTGGKDTSD